jgi:O-antigen/teichoic acid export membrane protein
LAARDDRAFLLSVTVGAVLNLVLNVALIPPLGVTGSALATLLAESIVIAMVSLRFWNTIGRIELEWHRLIRAAFALGGTVALLLLLRSVAPWWGTLLASGVGYVTLLVAVRAVMVAEIRQVLRDRT